MKGSLMRHPGEEQLLRYSDGELPSRPAGHVRSHVKACWECRVALHEIQDVVSECVGYRKNVLQRYFPPPPAPWMDIYRGFSEIDASMEPAFFGRLARALAWPFGNLRGWAIAAVIVLAIGALVYRFRQTPSVRAAELLQKAVIAESGRVEKPRTIQIRTRDRRMLKRTGVPSQLSSSQADAEALKSVEALFRSANYDWDQPLSAKSFLAWRNQLAGKRDEVIEEPGDYRIRTSADSGELTQATLELSAADLRPIEGRFEFQDREWVEITEAPDSVSATAAAPIERRAPEAGADAHASETPAGSSPSSAEPSATIGDELHALAALHRIGADLGDPVTVSLVSGQVVVTGEGIAPRREQQIRDALASSAFVVLHFSEAPPDRAPQGRAAPSDVSVAPEARELQDRIANQLGGRAYFEQLSSQVLDLSEPIMSRAYALRRLSEQFPSGAESQLNAADRQLLGALLRDHAAALQRQTAEIDRLLRPVLTKAGGIAPASDASLPAAWQPATEVLFQSARRLDKLLAVVFGASPSEAAGTQLSSELLADLANFRSRLEAYGRLAPSDPERGDK